MRQHRRGQRAGSGLGGIVQRGIDIDAEGQPARGEIAIGLNPRKAVRGAQGAGGGKLARLCRAAAHRARRQIITRGDHAPAIAKPHRAAERFGRHRTGQRRPRAIAANLRVDAIESRVDPRIDGKSGAAKRDPTTVTAE